MLERAPTSAVDEPQVVGDEAVRQPVQHQFAVITPRRKPICEPNRAGRQWLPRAGGVAGVGLRGSVEGSELKWIDVEDLEPFTQR